MQATFKHVKGKKTDKTHKTWEKFAKFTVSFTHLSEGKKDPFRMPLTLTGRNIQCDGSPRLTIGGTDYPGGFIIQEDFENLNPAAIHFTILGLGCYQARNSTQSTLFVRMKPFLLDLFTKLAHLCFDNGDNILVQFKFEDEIVTETEETEPDQIFFTCSSKATKAIGQYQSPGKRPLKIVYNKGSSSCYFNRCTDEWGLSDLSSIIVPNGISDDYDVATMEGAFLDLAKNMFDNSPPPEDVKIWNFQAVTKTVTEIVLV